MEVDPGEAIAQAKARAAAVQAERRQAAREAAAARRASAQAAAEPMDTLDELVASSRKRALDSCPSYAPAQLAHMGFGGCLSSQPGSQG